MFALRLLLFATAFLVMGFMAGGCACIVAVQFADVMLLTREAGLLLLLTVSSVLASFLFSVAVSLYVASCVIKREGEMKLNGATGG